jgi:hypothetical protein
LLGVGGPRAPPPKTVHEQKSSNAMPKEKSPTA